MNLKRLLIGGWKTHAFSSLALSSSVGSTSKSKVPNVPHPPCVVVFGRPGAGKSTVADAAVKSLENDPDIYCLGLDLDVCVPQWMRDNFAKGIYPTLKEREIFAQDCCDYVDNEVEKKMTESITNLGVIISFSFVNTDLRDIFRSRIPANWVLIDTTEDEATRRINMRQDHFYKGEQGESSSKIVEDEKKKDIDDVDNSEWKFAPVDFEHLALDGTQPVEENAQKVVRVIRASME